MDDDVIVESPAKKRKKNPSILNGKFYTIVSENYTGIEAKCTLCGEIKKGHISSTGNFISHYKLKHPYEHGKMKEETQLAINSNKVTKMRQSTLINSPVIKLDVVRLFNSN